MAARDATASKIIVDGDKKLANARSAVQQCAKSATNVKCGRKFRSRLYCSPSFVSTTAHHFLAKRTKRKKYTINLISHNLDSSQVLFCQKFDYKDYKDDIGLYDSGMK